MFLILSNSRVYRPPLLPFILIFSQCSDADVANIEANKKQCAQTHCCRSSTRCASLTLLFSVVQTYVDTGIARGVAEVSTRRQNAPLRNIAEVCVSAGATPRCAQVYRSAGSGEQSMDASHSHQHT